MKPSEGFLIAAASLAVLGGAIQGTPLVGYLLTCADETIPDARPFEALRAWLATEDVVVVVTTRGTDPLGRRVAAAQFAWTPVRVLALDIPLPDDLLRPEIVPLLDSEQPHARRSREALVALARGSPVALAVEHRGDRDRLVELLAIAARRDRCRLDVHEAGGVTLVSRPPR